MKTIHSFLILAFTIITASAQNPQITYPATNQWIDFDKTYYKIKVAEDGIYRVDYQTLIEQGFPDDFMDAKRFSLIREGEEVPLFIHKGVRWEEGSYIEFYGQKLDGKFDQRLYKNPEDQLHPYWSQFTDTAVYFLSYAEQSRKIIEVENDFSNLPEKESYFKYTSAYYKSNSHSNGIPDARIKSQIFRENGEINSHFASYSQGEGWIGHLYAANNPLAGNIYLASVKTPSVFYNDLNANITIKIAGVSMDIAIVNDHHLQVRNNNELLIDDKFDGYSIQKYNFDMPVNDLNTPETNFEFTAVPSEAITDKQVVSYITINYPRSYDFEDVDHLAFSIESKQEGNYLEFENLKVGHDFLPV